MAEYAKNPIIIADLASPYAPVAPVAPVAPAAGQLIVPVTTEAHLYLQELCALKRKRAERQR